MSNVSKEEEKRNRENPYDVDIYPAARYVYDKFELLRRWNKHPNYNLLNAGEAKALITIFNTLEGTQGGNTKRGYNYLECWINNAKLAYFSGYDLSWKKLKKKGRELKQNLEYFGFITRPGKVYYEKDNYYMGDQTIRAAVHTMHEEYLVIYKDEDEEDEEEGEAPCEGSPGPLNNGERGSPFIEVPHQGNNTRDKTTEEGCSIDKTSFKDGYLDLNSDCFDEPIYSWLTNNQQTIKEIIEVISEAKEEQTEEDQHYLEKLYIHKLQLALKEINKTSCNESDLALLIRDMELRTYRKGFSSDFDPAKHLSSIINCIRQDKDWRTRLQSAGVYNKSLSKSSLFVGKSIEEKSRLKNQFKNDKAVIYLMNAVHYMPISSEECSASNDKRKKVAG